MDRFLKGESDRSIGARNGTEHALEFLQRHNILVVARHRDSKVCHSCVGVLRAYALLIHVVKTMKLWAVSSPDKIFFIFEIQHGVVISPEKVSGMGWPCILQDDSDTPMNDQRRH
jgi:hypothetical protein